MSSFTDPLIVEPNDAETSWTLMQPFRYWITKLHEGDVITVPKGFVTDFASIPQIFWNILPPTGKYGKAAVVHDYLYQHNGIIVVSEDGVSPVVGKTFTRKQCDNIFLDAMACLGVSWLTRHIMYQAVNWFGFLAWNGHKKNKGV